MTSFHSYEAAQWPKADFLRIRVRSYILTNVVVIRKTILIKYIKELIILI